jgi:hypothetical protein
MRLTDPDPRYPIPPAPPMPEPGPRAPLRPPMVYVPPTWEYRHLARQLGGDALPTAEELNLLGGEGWELAAVIPDGARVHFYFKRLRE